MSFNISKDYLDYATSVKVTIDTTKFGPRQIKSFERGLKKGIVEGWGAPARIALRLRRTKNLPTIHLTKHSGIRWGSMPPEKTEFFDAVTAAVVHQKMTHVTPDYITRRGGVDPRYDYLDKVGKAAADKVPSGSAYYIADAMKPLFKTIDLRPYEGEVPTTFDIDMMEGGY